MNRDGVFWQMLRGGSRNAADLLASLLTGDGDLARSGDGRWLDNAVELAAIRTRPTAERLWAVTMPGGGQVMVTLTRDSRLVCSCENSQRLVHWCLPVLAVMIFAERVPRHTPVRIERAPAR